MTKVKGIVVALATVLFLLCASASAQSISIVSGNGQLICPACPRKLIPTFNPLVVLVKDAAGRPVPGATVTWTYTNVQASTGSITSTTTTDANGQSSNTVFMNAALGSLFSFSYAQGSVTAQLTALPSGTTGNVGQSVTFYETVALTDQQTTPGSGSGIIQVQSTVVSPEQGTVLTGSAGSVNATNPIQVRVTGLTGGGIPNVAVIVVPPADPSVPTISCATTGSGQPNTALTDATGTATCNVQFGGRQGQGQAQVVIGQPTTPFDTFAVNYQITQGLPGSIQIVSGNNQSGNAGALLTAPLVAIVGDPSGNPLADVNVTWTVSQGSGTLSNIRTTSDATGRVSANLTLGSSPGAIKVTVAVANSPTVNASFTENVNLAISQFQTVSGNNQSAAINTAFGQPLIVQVFNNGVPVSGAGVSFAVTSGTGTVSTATATTDAQGRAQVTVQAGNTAGPLTITATIGTFTQMFALTVTPPGPALTSESFRNAASGQTGGVSPCSLATMVAQGLAPGVQGVIAPPIVGALPLLVNNTTVAFTQPPTFATALFAPIWSVSNVSGQESIVIEVPCELSPGTASVTVNGPGGSKTVNVMLQPAAPGIFETPGTDRTMRGVVIRPDGSFASRENPVRKGETAHMLVTGLGPVTPAVGTNQVGIPGTDSMVTDNLIVGVNNAGVQIVKATYASDLIGVYDIAFVVPSDAPSGDLHLDLAVNVNGTLIYANGSIIPVQ